MKIHPLIYIVIAAVLLFSGFLFISKSRVQPERLQTTQEDQKTVVEPILTVEVVMKPNAFDPETITIQKNTQVIFKNEDSKPHWPASDVHPIHSIYPEFDPRQAIDSGKEWSFIFDKVGNWRFHDHLSPSLRGEIKVVESLNR